MSQGYPKGPLISLPKSGRSWACLNTKLVSHMLHLCKKIKEIDALLSETLSIKESSNLIGQEYFGL